MSSGALYARVDGAPCELVRFTNGRIPAAAAFVRAMRDGAATAEAPAQRAEQGTGDTGHAFTRWAVFRRTMRFAPRQPAKLALVVAALLLHTGANVAAPYLAGTVFFDRVLTPADTLFGQVGLLVAMIALVRLAELVFRVVWGWIWGLYHHRIGLNLRSAVFAGVHRLSLGFFSNNLTGSLLTRMNSDMNGVGSLLGTIAPNGFVQAVMMVGSIERHAPSVPFGGRQGAVLQRLQRQLLGAVPVECVRGDVEVQLALPAFYLVMLHSHPSSTASRASTSRRSIVRPYSWRTAITVRANRQRLRSGSQSAASFATFSWRFNAGVASVRLSRSLTQRFRTARLSAQSPLSCASDRATMCSMSDSLRLSCSVARQSGARDPARSRSDK